jgi:plastocyanin
MLKLLRGHRRSFVLTVALIVVAISSVSALAAVTKQVKVADDYFGAKHLTISKGGRVSWKWEGFLNHNVKVKTGPVKFHSKTQVVGTFSHVFTRKGTYVLYCTLHPETMKMTVVVK